jgi:spore germination protein YaaH
VIRRFLALLALLAVLTASLAAPGIALGDEPTTGTGPPIEIPPLRPDGPVTLPDGRVLPARPAAAPAFSVQAEMLEAHGADQMQFAPGEPPQPLGAPASTLSLASGTAGQSIQLGLAPTSGATATLAASATLPNGLRREVLGFLPYWMLDAGSLQWMRYDLVSTIAYFGVAAYADGTLATTSTGWSGWNSSAMTNVINAAHARGVKVVLTVTMMAWDGGAAQGALLGNATARAQLVNAIVNTVRSRAADGVNLDFEPVSTTLRDQYTSFVRQLKAGLVAGGVGSYLTVCTMGGAAVWASGYDLAGLTAAGAAEAVFVMGYDFSWSGSARAGGVAPMESPYVLDVQDSIDSYLTIIPGSKIIFGVPYYGRTWLTTSSALNATTVAGAAGSSKAYYYTGARNLAATHGRRWDAVGKVPWFAYYDSTRSTWVQGYYDDALSLAAKYDMINARDLAGTGMWTLLMDQGDSALWDLLAAKFVNDTTPASYVALPPARVLDSRFGNGLSGKFSAGVPRSFQVAGRGGVPANASAVTGNLTVTNQTRSGAAYLGPVPTANPGSSTLNFPLGDNRANGVTLALGAGGTLSATYLAASGTTDFIFDVTGYFVP